jgi:hypothetical protein
VDVSKALNCIKAPWMSVSHRGLVGACKESKVSVCANVAYLVVLPVLKVLGSCLQFFVCSSEPSVKRTVHGTLNRNGVSVASLHDAMHCHEDRLKQVLVVVANNLP